VYKYILESNLDRLANAVAERKKRAAQKALQDLGKVKPVIEAAKLEVPKESEPGYADGAGIAKIAMPAEVAVILDTAGADGGPEENGGVAAVELDVVKPTE
jgi:hypothetical protein